MNMKREELLRLDPENVDRLLTPLEVVYIAWTLGAFWKYDYEAARQGKVGMHAVLKSERHSNGFFISKVLLEPKNILNIMAHQIVMRLDEAKVPVSDFVGGHTERGD
jgi:hypothetical protein